MKITGLDTKFVDVDDKVILDSQTNRPITLRMVLVNGVTADVDQNGQPLRGTAKAERFAIYLKLKDAKDSNEIEFTPEEITLLREAVGVFSTIIAGQARAALDPKH